MGGNLGVGTLHISFLPAASRMKGWCCTVDSLAQIEAGRHPGHSWTCKTPSRAGLMQQWQSAGHTAAPPHVSYAATVQHCSSSLLRLVWLLPLV